MEGVRSIPQTYPYLQMQIADQGFVVGFQGVEGPVITVPRHGQQGRFHMLSMNGAVEGTEPVHQRFELGGHHSNTAV